MKNLSFMLLLALSCILVSCNDCDENKYTASYKFSHNYTVTAANGSTAFYDGASFTYEIDYYESEVDIIAENVRFSPMMPAITMEIDDVPCTVYANGGISLKGSNIIPEVGDKDMPEYTITTLNGRIEPTADGESKQALLSFSVNGAFNINVYPSPMRFEYNCNTVVSSPASSSTSSQFTSEKTSYIVYLDKETSTATIKILNAQFAQMMPAMDILLKNIPFTSNANGFTISAEDITPNLADSAQTPFPSYPIQHFEATITDGTISVNFNCNPEALSSLFIVNSSANMLPSSASSSK